MLPRRLFRRLLTKGKPKRYLLSMQAKHTASDFSMDFPLLRIGKTVFEKKLIFLQKALKLSKAPQKLNKKPKHFHNICSYHSVNLGKQTKQDI